MGIIESVLSLATLISVEIWVCEKSGILEKNHIKSKSINHKLCPEKKEKVPQKSENALRNIWT